MVYAASAQEIPAGYDQVKELKAFDDTKAGVKGLVDAAGFAKIPQIFVCPLDNDELTADDLVETTPLIDLQGMDLRSRRAEIVEAIRHASETWGLFQLVNHGIPNEVMEEMLKGTRTFHEQDNEVKKELYVIRDTTKRFQYNRNGELEKKTKIANWRDSFVCHFYNPEPPLDPQELPEICRDIIVEYTKQVKNLGETLNELLSEALGLKPDHLKSLKCAECLSIAGHYSPACPEPELTLNTNKHSDPTSFTILLQDDIGGLQFLHQDRWVTVQPIPGSLVVNIGDLLQLISNDKFKSVKHRVLANRVGPRVSVACFMRPNMMSTMPYGPIKELLSENSPPMYREILLKEYDDTARHILFCDANIDVFATQDKELLQVNNNDVC